MDFNLIAESDSSDKLKCAKCKNYLSYFPVSIHIESLESYCGRCITPDGSSYIQNVPFEHVAQYLQFPCRYNGDGCTMELHPKDMPQHERSCIYQLLPCPCTMVCAWTGVQSNFLTHCQDTHKDMFLKNHTFTLDISKAVITESKYFIEWINVLYIFDTIFDPKTLSLNCSLFASQLEPNKSTFLCELSAKVHNMRLILTLNSSPFDGKEFYKFSLESLRSATDDGIIVCQLNMRDCLEIEGLDQKKINWDILSALKCSICEGFAIPPIIMCSENKSDIHCEDCTQSELSKCHPCYRRRRGNSNFQLNNIAKLQNYPCENHSEGCIFISKPHQILKHQLECELGVYCCQLQCGWFDSRKNLHRHFETDHSTVFIPNSKKFFKTLLTETEQFNVIKFCNRLFLVSYSILLSRYTWFVDTIDFLAQPYNFLYEIEVFAAESDRKLSAIRECCTAGTVNQIFPTYFSTEQLSEFLDAEGRINFKVRIIRKN